MIYNNYNFADIQLLLLFKPLELWNSDTFYLQKLKIKVDKELYPNC